DVREAHRASRVREPHELVGMVVARHGQMRRRRPQVLPEREDRYPDTVDVTHRLEQLGLRLAETDDDAGLRDETGRAPRDVPEDVERPRVTPAVPRELVEPRHRLGVVIED